MGRWKKNQQRYREIEKRVTLSVSVPKYLTDILKGVNKSEVVTTLLRENAERIGELSSDDLSALKRKEMISIILSTLEQKNPEMIKVFILARTKEMRYIREAIVNLISLLNEEKQYIMKLEERLVLLSKQIKKMESSDTKTIRTVMNDIVDEIVRKYVPKNEVKD
jgi:hypothetical protein